MIRSSVDYLLGAIDYHDWEDVCCWHHSARRNGFRGKVVLICYEHLTASAIRRIQSSGIAVLPSISRRGVNEDRFRDAARFVSTLAPSDRVLMTDVRDVAFQISIHELLDAALAFKPLACASEGVTYAESAWNLANVNTNFPRQANHIRQLEVYCAGVLAGVAGRFEQFLSAVWLKSSTALSFNGDQIALNLVIRDDDFAEDLELLPPGNSIICHFGTTLANAKSDTATTLTVRGGRVYSPVNELVGVFHQYTKDPSIRRAVLKHHGSLLEFYTGKLRTSILRGCHLQPSWQPYWKS